MCHGLFSVFAERVICRDHTVGSADDDLNAAYQAARSTGVDPALVADQRAWIVTRNACRTTLCVRRQYSTRISQLNAYINVHGGGGPAGFYTKLRYGWGQMSALRTGQTWTVHLIAGGYPEGPSMAANCEITAVGTLSGNTFSGTFEPADDQPNRPATMTITFRNGSADLSADSGRACGMHDGVNGIYHLAR